MNQKSFSNSQPILTALFSVTSLFVLTSDTFAQVDKERAEMKVAKEKRAAVLSKRHNMKDRNVRNEVVRQLKEANDELRDAVKRKAKKKGLLMEGVRPDGRSYRLVDFDENDLPVYEQSENVNAAITTAAHEVRASSTYNGVTGSSVTIGHWEAGGIPRITHREFDDRITIMDGNTTVSSHATHTAGTMIARGIDSRIEGMAPDARIAAFSATNEQSEMFANGASEAGTTDLYLSSHSYGVGQGWEFSGSNWVFNGTFSDDGNPDNDFERDFGRYASTSVAWDGITYNLPYYLVFVSSGNHRNDGPNTGNTWVRGNVSYTYDPNEHPGGDGDYKNGWDNMEGRKIAKNVIVVGNSQDAVTNGVRDVSKAVTNSSSSRGPADDGRLKPDITANGTSLRSADSGSDTSTGVKTGTSMSTPSVAGSAALLVDYYSSRFPGEAMRASTLKALILHTADDDGNPGPDYRYGWGIMNTKEAAEVLRKYANGDAGAMLLESTVSDDDDSRNHTFGWDGSSPLRVTLCWTDPAGTQKFNHEDRAKALVNDLNITVTGPDGTHYPYVMPHVGDWSIGSIDDDAETGVNTVDNVEQVYLEVPSSGTYTITVNFAGNLTGDEQDYSLIVTGQDAPEIVVEEGDAPAVALSDNSGLTDFGARSASEGAVVKNFTIRNTGGSPLTGLAVTKSGVNSGDFIVGALSVTELATDETTSFSISYHPGGAGTRSARLQIASNDSDEAPFDINLSATGLSELQAWRVANFGTSENTGNAADDFDADGDGMSNQLEFGLGSDPEKFDVGLVSLELEETVVKVFFPRSVVAMTEFTIDLLWSNDLALNSWFGTDVTEVILGDDGVTQEVEATVPRDNDRKFFRVRMTEKE